MKGKTDNEAIIAEHESRKRSLISTVRLSQGVPMILGGDELSKTQNGNNNAYCHDNEINWYDWDLDDRKRDFLEFVSRAVAFRRDHPSLRRRRFLQGRRDTA